MDVVLVDALEEELVEDKIPRETDNRYHMKDTPGKYRNYNMDDRQQLMKQHRLTTRNYTKVAEIMDDRERGEMDNR